MFTVESICRVLSEHGWPIASSTYRAALRRAPSARARRDEFLNAEITRVHADNYGVFGARKIWLVLNRQGVEVARCTVERLMRELGLRVPVPTLLPVRDQPVFAVAPRREPVKARHDRHDLRR